MSTIVKETDVSATVPDALSTRPTAANAAPNEAAVKPQPVALEVSVTVNGARTLDGSDKREPFSESTKTVLVFGNGAVIRLQSSVAPGQLLFLTNEKTKKEVVCQVVKSKNYRNVSGYVELEFTEPVIGFWGMRFPGDRIGAASAPTVNAPAPVNAAPATGSPAAPVANASAAPNSAPAKTLSNVPVQSPAVSAVDSAPAKSNESIHAVPNSRAVKTPDAIPAETKTPARSSQNAAPPQPNAPKPESAPMATTTPGAATPATVTPISPFVSKSSGSTSSSASSSVLPSSSVLTLPRAAQPKPTAPTHINLTPPAVREIPSQPSSAINSATKSAIPAALELPAHASEKPAPTPSAENSTEALKAENARLQEQLSALLFADAKKTDAAKAPAQTTGAPQAENKAAETAAKILDLAQSSTTPPAPVKVNDAAPVSASTPAPVAHTPVPPAPVAAKPATPSAKISTVPLPSLLEADQLKIPSWLEPLARNAATPAPVEQPAHETAAPESSASASAVFEEPVPDAHWLNKEGLYKDPSHQDSDEAARKDESLQSESQEYAGEVSGPAFGTRFLSDDKNVGEDGAPKSRTGLIAAIAATVLLAAGGGFWYTHPGAFTFGAAPAAQNTAATQQPATAQAAASPNSEVPRSAANTPGTTRPAGSIINQAAIPPALNTNMVVTPGHASQPTSSATISPAANSAQPSAAQPAAVQPKHASLGEVHLAAPSVNRTESAASANDADPSIALNGSPAPTDANLDANFGTTSGPAAPSNPIPVGGDVKTAQLLKSVPPIYPTFARTQHISGDVKIDALIDATGKVTTMKVVSGPTLLHQAAMDALHQWKYQPATLDGKTVPMHLTVTIQFRML
jgi:protein TonB